MKKVIITGGSRGIGRACVTDFSELGYRVAFMYAKSDAAAEELASLLAGKQGAFAKMAIV